MASEQVRVSALIGTGGILGRMDPIVDMQVYNGIDSRFIKSIDSDGAQVVLAITSGGTAVGKAYPHQLVITETTANYFGYPDANNSTTFTHHKGNNANGIPTAVSNKATFQNGDDSPDVSTF